MGAGYEPGTEGSVPFDQDAAPQSTQQRGGSRRMAQIKALMKRDYLVMRAHSRALIAELVFPLVMGTLACLFLTVFTNMSTGFNIFPNFNPYCNSYFTSYGPANLTHMEDLQISPGGTYVPLACGPWSAPSYWIPHENDTSLLDSYTNYVSTLTDVKGDDDYRLNAIMYFQNFSTPHNNINVYQTQQVSAWTTLPLGWAVNTLFNGPSTVEISMESSSNVMQFNMKQMFCTSAAIMLTVTFLPMASTMAGRLVDEKKAKVREHLKVMGVTSTSYLIAAFLVAMMRVGFVSLTLLILIGSFNIIQFKYLMAVWISLVFYGFSLAGFAQMMPAFFGRSTMSNAACSLFIAIPGIAAVFASQIPALVPVMAILFSPAAFVYSAAQLLNNNFVELPVSPGGCIACLIFQMFMYSAIAQYLYSINPGEFGVPRPLLFPIHDLMALCTKKKISSEREPLLNSNGGDGNNESPLLGGKRDRIVLENLVKVFGNEIDKPAVNKLSIGIREKEIFALLGHNGAGKTTTISMLIGMLQSTSYDVAKVLGYDLNTDMDNIREHIGICPQFDVLFDDLSARQHLDLYAAIKGRPVVDGDTLLTKLKLPLDNQKASTFSGGMKRRLSVGNALVGDSPILFLDEPSSGLDPVSRRQLWELLREEKNVKGKTIVLTTHFMEEADYLGDRIGIMSSGRLYCCDTSANLKSTYGVGYYLNFAKSSTAKGSAEHAGDSFNKSLAAEILGRYIEGWSLKQDSVGDITYLLPAASLPCFGDMLKEIEDNLTALGSSSYGLAMNTLEDVFVNISEKEVASAAAAAGKSVVDVASLDTTHTASGVLLEDLFSTAAISTPFLPRLLSQTWTIYVKKWMAMSRSLRIIFTCIVFPMVLVGVGFGAMIPNFFNNMSQNNSQSWASYYDNAEWPDEANMEIYIYQESDNWGPSLNKVLDTFTSMYIEYEHIRGYPNPQFSFKRLSKQHYMQGAFLSDGTISFLASYNPVVQMMFGDDMNSAITSPTAPTATLDIFFNDESWSAMYGMSLSAIMYASIETVWREANGNNTPVLLPAGIPIQVPIPPLGNHTAAPTTTTTTTQVPSNNTNGGEPDGDGPEFILVALAGLVNVCVGQFAVGVMLPLADELNKHIFHTMRLQGLSAAAFWLGTFGFDMTTGSSIMVAYIIGCYARGVTQIQNDLLPFQCFVLIGAISFAVLMVYALVLFLPSDLKPSTYMYASSGLYYLTLLVPMVAYIALVVSNKDCPMWLSVITPSRALYAAIVVDPTPTSSIWTSELAVGAGVSLGLWNALVIALVVFKSYISPRRSYTSAPDSINNNSNTYHQPIIAGVPLSNNNALDPDVLQEIQRVASSTDNMATTSHLRKVFPNVSSAGSADRDQSTVSTIMSGKCDKVAVNDLTFGVRSGECFGLLGPNGAGKTTTVKMMMRETAPSYGSVSFPYAPEATDVDQGILGSMDNSYKLARLGACQQGDTLWENFSAAEHMRLYLRIRLGSLYNDKDFEQYISNALQKVALDDVADKPAGSYSGGMKRKLSVCIAMYTGARTVFLDEPSTGMDPYARRALWRSIGEALQNDRCVLLTTHSMEEADAVCGRIGIVTGGVLQCIGSGQHLKNRFGSGYSITVTLHPRDANNAIVADTEAEANTDAVAEKQTEEAGKAVDSMLAGIFTDCGFELKEVLNLQRRYSVTQLPSLSFAFKTLNTQQQALGIANYSVSQLTSLEQIFINFAGTSTQSGN